VPRLSQTRAYVALLLIASLWGTFPATSKGIYTTSAANAAILQATALVMLALGARA